MSLSLPRYSVSKNELLNNTRYPLCSLKGQLGSLLKLTWKYLPQQTAFYVFAGALPAAIVGYQISRPGEDGEPSSLSTWLKQFDYFNDWETRNSLRTDMLEQAAHDKHLFLNAGKSTHIELKTPEYVNPPKGPSLSEVASSFIVLLLLYLALDSFPTCVGKRAYKDGRIHI